MHGMHARLPKNFVLEERLERYADAIELEPQRFAGCWAQACWPIGQDQDAEHAFVAGGSGGAFDEVRLDLGCGKGTFVIESARREPNVLFVGVDAEPLCIAYTAQHIMEEGLRNAVVVPGLGSVVAQMFGPGELGRIHLNFPTPYPRKREARRRLTILDRLLEYRQVLAPGGTIRLRTDSQPFRDFTLTQLDLAGYDVTWSSDDERAELPDEPTSEYEQRLVAQGASVYGLWATPSGEPRGTQQTASLSLVDYLPSDLFADGYVPHGMQQTIVNLRNQRRHRS